MKKLLIPVLACGMFASAFAQKPLEPCCSIIATDIKNNLVIARDNTTGRLYQFKADAMDIRSIQKGDAVNINAQTKKITAIGGAVRNYLIIQPDNAEPVGILAALRIDYAEPINDIVKPKINTATPISDIISIEIDYAEPISGIVTPKEPVGIITAKNKLTGKTFQFNVLAAIAKTLKVGNPVYADPVNGFAIVQSSYGSNNGEMNFFGYAMTALDGNKNDASPCCGIVAVNSTNNTALVRDNTTGRLYQFKADAMDMRSISKGDAVTIAGNKVSAINGSIRTYPSVRPDYGAPCCFVVSIQTDGGAPCCNAVTIKNNSTNKNFSISVPKQIAATLKAGQAVSIDVVNNLAVVQSSYGSSNGEMNSFGYPATSGEGATSDEKATDKWVITPVTNMKGVLGRLDINFPADVERNILIHRHTDHQFITSVSRNDKIYTMAPGVYHFVLSSVPVENVPIQKGHETRLKAGFLNVVSEGHWDLYSETKAKAYTSGNKPKKLPLPIGSYQLKLGLNFYPFVIKDGETVEY